MGRDTIVIAGATGFVGHAVALRLAARAPRLDIVGLTRGRRETTGSWDQLVSCDLFSLKDVEHALQGARYALYLYVTGGLLARPTERGRLEFRVTPDGKHLLTAIHEFQPRLPWLVYRFTQAIAHRRVMRRFGEHLGRTPPLMPVEERLGQPRARSSR